MAGAVQHGASTLPPEYFGHFPDHDCAEIHLATEFQNLPMGTRAAIGDSLEKKFRFLFEKLRVPGTRAVVARWIKPVDVFAAAPAAAGDRFVRDDQAGD